MSELPHEYRKDVREHLSVDQRINLARKVKLAPQASLSPDESLVLGDILQIVAQDAEVRVRQALAETLANSPHAPRDILQSLAKDDDLVASPILMLSDVLTQDDLIALIKSQISGAKMGAIAQRKRAPSPLCLALIENGDASVADQLLRNDAAEITEPGLNRIVDRHGKVAAVQSSLVNRETLPPKIIEKIVTGLSAEILARLVERHEVPENVSRRLVIDVRDRAVLGFTSRLSTDGMMNLVDQLVSEDRLTPSLILRSLVVGNVELIVHVIAFQCQLGPQYVRDRLVEGNAAAVGKLWQAAELPREWQELALATIAVLRDAATREWTPAYCRFQIVERFMSQFESVVSKLDPNDVAFLEAAREDALVDLAQMD